jgi:hypothetical protein
MAEQKASGDERSGQYADDLCRRHPGIARLHPRPEQRDQRDERHHREVLEEQDGEGAATVPGSELPLLGSAMPAMVRITPVPSTCMAPVPNTARRSAHNRLG